MLKAPAIGAIAALGLILMAVFLVWLGAAWLICAAHAGATCLRPHRWAPLPRRCLFTAPGQAMIVMGIGVGFVFALLAMMMSVVSLPAADGPRCRARHRDRDVLPRGDGQSRADGAVGPDRGGLLVAGTALAFVGLMVAVPVLGHATWHLYRKLIV